MLKFIELLGICCISIFWSLHCCYNNYSNKKKEQFEDDFDNIEISIKNESLFCCHSTPNNSPRVRSHSKFFNGLDDFI